MREPQMAVIGLQRHDEENLTCQSLEKSLGQQPKEGNENKKKEWALSN
jgi:hypothetical protein